MRYVRAKTYSYCVGDTEVLDKEETKLVVYFTARKKKTKIEKIFFLYHHVIS